jgi:seryl-tRNA synthetase
MLDLKRIRDDPDTLRTSLRRRRAEDLLPALDRLLELDERWRAALAEHDALRHDQNEVSKTIGERRRAGEDASADIRRMGELAGRIRELDAAARDLRREIDALLLGFPNAPHHSVPDGAGAEANVILRQGGETPDFGFHPKPHWEIGSALGILDLPRGTKIAGSGFPLFAGMGARLLRALREMMLDIHTKEHGYTEVSPPYVVHRTTMTGTGHLPKFEDDLYRVARQDADDVDGATAADLFLIPTAEVPLTSLHAEEILEADALPRYYTAYTPCFRREAGAAGRETRGILRVHQFDKVELVKITTPETSYEEHERMLADAERVVQRLELPYRIVSLCAGDLGFSAAKCYDIEVWAAAQRRWLEVSSVSNCEDFQAQRANIRYRPAAGKKPEFVHTLNGSGLAFPRVVIALLENNQQADGTVAVPAKLRPYLGADELR